jgi:hypothetical protein
MWFYVLVFAIIFIGISGVEDFDRRLKKLDEKEKEGYDEF